MELNEWLQTDLQKDIWEKKYRFGNESLDEWFNRISESSVQDSIKELMINKKFLPGGRILANRGLQKHGLKVSYSNCYVIKPPSDSIEAIYDSSKKLARTYSYGGGCGIDISQLAPNKAKVNNTAKKTSGAVSFMDLYDLTTGLIGQSGRRGALMISISDSHPDLLDFLEIKQNNNKITKANISVRITDDFMNAVQNNKTHKLSFYRKETNEEIVKEVNARKVFRKLAEGNWDWGEAGVLFWDRINNWSLLSEDENFEFAGVNP